jgi:hypothetical protein
MLVFEEDAAEAVVSADVQMRDAHRIGDWRRQRASRSGVGDALMRPMAVVEAFELAQGA